MSQRATEKPPWFVPEDYESRPWTETIEKYSSEVQFGGPGRSSTLACFDCANTEGNREIWHSWWCSRNGDVTTNDVIRCGKCKLYSLYIHES